MNHCYESNQASLTSYFVHTFFSSFDTHRQAQQIRGSDSNHVSHGPNDIRQLQGSSEVNVDVTVTASYNSALIAGNVHGKAGPSPTVSWC